MPLKTIEKEGRSHRLAHWRGNNLASGPLKERMPFLKGRTMTDDIREAMWKAMSDNPYLMIGLEGSHDHSIPMTAQLDKNADSCFWFYTTRDNRIAPGGRAMAQFVSKGQDVFACLSGSLQTETDASVIDRYWSNQVEAWYEGGRNDPNLLMLRFDLDDAEIWTVHPGIKGLFKMMTGQKIDDREFSDHAKVTL
jgi:general stress protein 26